MTTSKSNTTKAKTPGQDEISLRDHFATIALAQIIASKPHESAEKKALEAYQIADSMIRQRERTTSGLP